MPPPTLRLKVILLRLSCVMLSAAVLLPLTYLLEPVELTGLVALVAYWVAESGGTVGTPLIVLGMGALILSRAGLSWKQRAIEGAAIMSALALLFGGAAYLNEFVVKPYFAVHRPGILELARTAQAPAVLGMSAEEFYALPTKELRNEHLKKVLTPEVAPRMDDYIRGHWIHETGYSFPSGHAFSAMLVATVFLALALTFLAPPRLWFFYLLVVWAVAVCYSRPILRVHSPLDVCAGGLEGIVCGVLCFLLTRLMLEFWRPQPPRSADPGSAATPPMK